MTTTNTSPSPDCSEPTDQSPLDLRQIRSHARKLQADLESIKAELASMKALYAPAEDEHEPVS